METRAYLKLLRITPRKVNLVAKVIRRKNVFEALKLLSHINKKSATPLTTLLNSAIANSKQNKDIVQGKLFVKQVLIGKGPTLKRMQPRSKGRAFRILKHTSRVTIILDEFDPKYKQKQKNKVEEKSTPFKVEKSEKKESKPIKKVVEKKAIDKKTVKKTIKKKINK